MREAEHTPTTPTAPAEHYVKARQAIPVTIMVPGQRETVRQVNGRILGTMHARSQVHHYRVAGADGVLYLCPPSWLPENPLTPTAPPVRTGPRDFVPEIERIIAMLEDKRIPHEGKVS